MLGGGWHSCLKPLEICAISLSFTLPKILQIYLLSLPYDTIDIGILTFLLE